MADGSRLWLLLPEPIRRLPADLAATSILTLLAGAAALLPLVRETPLRVVLGLPLVLFLPGYALVAALFPEEGSGPGTTDTDESDTDAASQEQDRDGIDGIERVALSFGLSIAVTPLIGLVLNFTPWGIRLVPILVGVGGFTLVATAVAAHRRRQLPSDDRFTVPYREWLAGARAELFEPDSRTDAALNVLLALSIILAVASVGYAVAVPKEGEAFTELYLLTEQEDGDLVAANYPTNFTQGESRSLIVGIGNHEHEAVTYTTVIELQRVQVANNSTTVLEQRELQRFTTRVGANQTLHRPTTITPTLTGERLRLAFLLYKGDPPANPTVDNAYREVHLWVTVEQ